MNVSALVFAGALAAAGLLGQAGKDAAPLTPKVTAIKEIRESKIETPKQDGMSFSMSSDKPGLRVMLSVPMSGGLKLLEVVQPKTITAKDSAGTDLTKIEEGFHGEREYVQKDQFVGFDDDDTKAAAAMLTLVLGSPAREAKTFSASCEAGAVLGGPVKSVALAPAKDWTALEAPELAGLGAKYKLTRSSGQTTLEFDSEKPKSVIGDVTIVTDGKTTKSSGWMSTNGSLSYIVDAAMTATSKITINVHTNVRTVPLKIELKDVKLP